MKRSLRIGIYVILALIALWIIIALVWGKTIQMAKANRLLTSSKPEQARVIYEQMAASSPQSPYILHNLGLAFYQKAQYDKAVANLENAQTKIETKEAHSNGRLQQDLANRVHYNLGNSLFKQAEKSPGGQSGNAYQRALDDFKKAIVADRRDLDAKYNYELTNMRLQEEQKNNSQKNTDKNQNQNKNQGQNKQPNPKDSSKKGAGKQGSSSNPSADKNSSSQPGKGQMTKEQAEELLRMMKNQDQSKAPVFGIREEQPKQDW